MGECWFDESDVRACLKDFFSRCETIRMAGGIAMEEVVDGAKEVPQGWVLDRATDYFVPPNLFLTDGGRQ